MAASPEHREKNNHLLSGKLKPIGKKFRRLFPAKYFCPHQSQSFTQKTNRPGIRFLENQIPAARWNPYLS
jgi:hypothetical protein